MAKNVVITEDGVSKTINDVLKISTYLEDGGTCLWVPEDEYKLKAKTITQDGTYKPSDDGCYAYSTVTVQGVGTTEMGTLISKTVKKNGTYNITDESGNPYGYSSITVNVDTSSDDGGSGGGSSGSSPITGKDEDGNDAMVESDGENVSVTVLPTKIKVIIPPKKNEYNRYEKINYSGISVYAYVSKMPHSIGTIITPIFEGSNNPVVNVGGKNITATIGDMVIYAPDRTGKNDEQLVWDGNKWINRSNYSSEMAPWSSSNYPGGKIPFDELIFPNKEINYDKESNSQKVMRSAIFDKKIIKKDEHNAVAYKNTDIYNINIKSKNLSVFTGTNATPYFIAASSDPNEKINIIYNWYINNINNYKDRYTVYTDDGPEEVIDDITRIFKQATTSSINTSIKDITINKKIFFSVTGLDAKIVQSESLYSTGESYEINFDLSHEGDMESTINERSYSGSTFYGKTVYYAAFHFSMPNGVTYDDNIDNKYNTANKSGAIAWTMVYGNPVTTAIDIPVQWKRPGDGKILETTFTTWMNDTGGT